MAGGRSVGGRMAGGRSERDGGGLEAVLWGEGWLEAVLRGMEEGWRLFRRRGHDCGYLSILSQ
jgi:hypothetical protein